MGFSTQEYWSRLPFPSSGDLPNPGIWERPLNGPRPKGLRIKVTVYLIFSLLLSLKVKVAQWCSTLWDPTDYTTHGILQDRIVEWVAFPFSRGPSQPRDWTQVSLIAGWFWLQLLSWATREALSRQKFWTSLYAVSNAGGRRKKRYWI